MIWDSLILHANAVVCLLIMFRLMFFNKTGKSYRRGVSLFAYLTVKAAGVWAGDVETPSIETPSEGSKFFGFDLENEYIGGFDVGAWGKLL
ncbi:phage holin family protein [Enterobacter kobei]|uniref:phage holin family protein n=1 Tax=Enterobacter kobei TaxID=208224 RepID=UPI00237C41BA|nr:phage holin family protein [Enterobacter kobei]